jgi:hypothetical protein
MVFDNILLKFNKIQNFIFFKISIETLKLDKILKTAQLKVRPFFAGLNWIFRFVQTFEEKID